MGWRRIALAAATLSLACGRSDLNVGEHDGFSDAPSTAPYDAAGGATSDGAGGTTDAGAHDAGTYDGGPDEDANGVAGCSALVVEQTAVLPQPSPGNTTHRLVFSRPDESQVVFVRHRVVATIPGPACKPSKPNSKCYLGHHMVDALELDPLGSWAALGDPTAVTGYGRGLVVGTAATEGIALLYSSRKYLSDPGEMRFAPEVDLSNLPLESVAIDDVDGRGLFVSHAGASSFLAYTFRTEPAEPAEVGWFTRYGHFSNGVFSAASEYGCTSMTSVPSGAAEATDQGFLFALSSGVAGGGCQSDGVSPGKAQRVQVIWTPDPSTYTSAIDLDTGDELIAVRMVRRSAGAWVLWLHMNIEAPESLMGLRVDPQGNPQSAPQVLIPSVGSGDGLAYARLGERLVVAHRSDTSISSANEIALHVFDDHGSELFVTHHAPPTGSLGGRFTLLGGSAGDRLLMAHDWVVPGPNPWDVSEEGVTLVRYACSSP